MEDCRFFSSISGLCTAETNIDSGYKYYCKNCPNCYYKQLKQKEKEIEELKEENKKLKRKVFLMMDCVECKVDEYQEKLDKIKGMVLGNDPDFIVREAVIDIINEVEE